MCGQLSENFLTGLRSKMTINTMVKKGWYYRRSPIVQGNSPLGLIVQSPYWDWDWIEKLRYSKKSDSYSIEDIEDCTLVVEVLWEDNTVSRCPLANLVEVL